MRSVAAMIDATNRRSFLTRLGGAAAATRLSLLAPLAALTAARADARDQPSSDHRRATEAYRIRNDAAFFQRSQPLPAHRDNGDEILHRTFVAHFTKGLPHNALGDVNAAAYDALRKAVASGASNDYELVPLGGVEKLACPQAALAYALEGRDSHGLPLRVPPAFSSAEQASEMVELYWQALTRDVPFAQYDTHPDIAAAADSLSQLSDFRGPMRDRRVTPRTIFRGDTPGDLAGPYISQFLLKPVPFGPYPIDQRLRPGTAGLEYMTAYRTWLDIQNGAAPAVPYATEQRPRYINDNRALAHYVKMDFSSQAFLNAALILLATPRSLAPSNPYHTSTRQAAFTTFGGPDVLGVVTYVPCLALKAAWFHKWVVHRRVRPEAFGGALHNTMTGAATAAIHRDLLDSPVLAKVRATWGSYLLPMAYPEGCPLHPSYPAGHAAFAGACATVLKAFFNEEAELPAPVVASADGSTLERYDGTLTIGGELNKLAANIAIGRNAAGVHWRSDGLEGLNLGEAVAIGLLQDLRRCYTEQFTGFTFTRFDGRRVTI